MKLFVQFNWLFAVLLLLQSTYGFNFLFITGFKSQHGQVQARLQQQRISMSGYISPERDPEYRTMVKKSLLQPELQTESLLPIPREGDIVQYPGKWQGELQLGRIRFVRYSSEKEAWVADIVPLKEGKSENVYTVDRNAGTFFENVENIVPVRSFFLRNENGYKIAYRKNTTNIILKAPAYRVMNSTYVQPSKPISLDVLAEDMKRYEELKNRMVLNTIKFATIGGIIVQFAFGSEVSGPYLLGGGAGALYLYLLGKKTDGIGASYALELASSSGQSKLDAILAKSRFVVPLVLILALGAKSSLLDGRAYTPFSIVPRDNFLGAIAGFLTYRLALFATEVATELRTEDLLSVVPGSFAEGYRISKDLKAKEAAGIAAGNAMPLVPVIFVTGPKAAGHSSLAARIKFPNSATSNREIKFVKFLTTDPLTWRKNPERFQLIETVELDKLRSEGGLIYEGQEQTAFGEPTNIALALRDFKPSLVDAKATKVAYLVDGQTDILESLSRIPSFQLLNIWISLQTKEQFIEKASQIVQNEVLLQLKEGKDKNALASKSAQIVSDLVNEAARDITFYMSKAPLFEYTLLNSGSEDETLDELEQLLSNTL